MTSTAAPSTSGHVLVADDDADMRELVRRILVRDGYEVSEAKHGLELLERLSDQESGIDVVVSDIRMPVLSGVEVMALTTQLVRPAVILMTAFAEPELTPFALAVGAVAVLSKPFEPGELRGLVRMVLDGVRRAKPAP